MVVFDRLQVIHIVDHYAQRLLQAVVGEITEWIVALHADTVAELEGGDRVVGDAVGSPPPKIPPPPFAKGGAVW